MPRESAIGRTIEDRRAIAEALALARMDKKRRAKTERESRQIDADLRKMGSALDRAERARKRASTTWLTRKITPRSSRRSGATRCPRIELMAGLAYKRASNRGPDGMSTFHFGWTSRGLGDGRQKSSHCFRSGETVRHLKYILRESAREAGIKTIVSNISSDPDEIAGVLAELELIETCGRANANVYISIVIALPHELTPEGRVRAIRRIFGAFDDEGLPYVAVPHAPDPNGDPNNYHCHGMASLRLFRKEDDGRYSFAAESLAKLNDGEWITFLRGHIATVLNEEMATEGHDRRFTPLSNRARGMAPPPRGSGKRGPGRNAAARREAELERLQGEGLLLAGRRAAIERLQSTASAILNTIDAGHEHAYLRIKDAMLSVIAARKRDLTIGAAARSALMDRLTRMAATIVPHVVGVRARAPIAESQFSKAVDQVSADGARGQGSARPPKNDRAGLIQKAQATSATPVPPGKAGARGGTRDYVGEIRRAIVGGRAPALADLPEVPRPSTSSPSRPTGAQPATSQTDFERLRRADSGRTDDDRRRRRADLDRAMKEIADAATFRIAWADPDRTFLADLRTIVDSIDRGRVWLVRDGTMLRVRTGAAGIQQLFVPLQDLAGRAALSRLADALVPHAQPDTQWAGELTMAAAAGPVTQAGPRSRGRGD